MVHGRRQAVDVVHLHAEAARPTTRCCSWRPRTTRATARTSARRRTRARTTWTTTSRRSRDAGIGYDVYDVDAHGRTAPDRSACSSTTRRSSGTRATTSTCASRAQPGGTGTAKLVDDEILAVRDFMNEGGKLLVTGQERAAGRVGPVPLQPARATPPPFCKSQPDARQARRPTTRRARSATAWRFQRLPAVLARGVPAIGGRGRHRRGGGACRCRETPPFGSTGSGSTAATRRTTRTTCTRS